MIQISTPQPKLISELSEVVRLFFDDKTSGGPDVFVVHAMEGLTHTVSVKVGERETASIAEQPQTDTEIEYKREYKRAAKVACYRALASLTGERQPWGSLTGVRPTKLMHDLCERGQDGRELFRTRFDVSPARTRLAYDTYMLQETLMANISEDAVCVYIGIPFCVSRCSYCSFPGRIAKKGEMQSYLTALKREITAAAQALSPKEIYAVYIGGGTPTSFPEDLFCEFISHVRDSFGAVPEFTLEAGRPDTLKDGKLRAAYDAGVTRLCVNPQTMSRETLARIGRNHTPEDIERVFYQAREMGFHDINMDIIAGLPGETVKEFAHTLSCLQELKPDSFTAHTLSIKRGSILNMSEYAHVRDVESMVDRARETAEEMGLRPYYLYRQKHMAGNLENVGYALPGCESLYNIGMMEEKSTVLALGVGAISKHVRGEQITRVPNPKDLHMYLERIDAICAGKETFFGLDSRETGDYTEPNSNDEEE